MPRSLSYRFRYNQDAHLPEDQAPARPPLPLQQIIQRIGGFLDEGMLVSQREYFDLWAGEWKRPIQRATDNDGAAPRHV